MGDVVEPDEMPPSIGPPPFRDGSEIDVRMQAAVANLESMMERRPYDPAMTDGDDRPPFVIVCKSFEKRSGTRFEDGQTLSSGRHGPVGLGGHIESFPVLPSRAVHLAGDELAQVR